MVILLLVWDYFNAKLTQGPIHLTLLDPNKQSAKDAAEMGAQASDAGTDGIMIGGSTGISRESFDQTICSIKDQISLPVVIFPTNANSLSENADAVFFMSLLNSKSIRFLTREQVHGARFVKENDLETISMGYVVVSPGMMVGQVGEAELIERDDYDSAVNYSLIAQYFGMKLVYLEAGSGAPKPVPAKMIKKVKSNIDIPLIVGGGIRTPDTARTAAKAGADIIVTGTVVEDAANIRQTLEEIISTIKETRKETA
jgi:phosphoglycerol geranylgeranyltransferase